jgi:hypothetical protein
MMIPVRRVPSVGLKFCHAAPPKICSPLSSPHHFPPSTCVLAIGLDRLTPEVAWPPILCAQSSDIPSTMNIAQPIVSGVEAVEFEFLSPKEIRSMSVKRIENDSTFDNLLNPVPGGLYDPALGSWGDSP